MSDLAWKPLLNPQHTAERFLAESDEMPRRLRVVLREETGKDRERTAEEPEEDEDARM